MVGALTALFAATWKAEVMPTGWGVALIKYLYKGKGSKREVSNYRPISLISVVAKLFTITWLPQLMECLVPGLALEQGCAKAHQGAMEALWALMATVEDCMEGRDMPMCEGQARKDKKTRGVYALFADVHKA